MNELDQALTAQPEPTPAVSPWDEVAAANDPKRVELERDRCLAIVRSAIDAGLSRGVPQTSATIRILQGIAAEIEHGFYRGR